MGQVLGRGARSILKNGAILVGSTWIEILLRLLYLVVITRLLGAESYAVWAYAIASYGVALGAASLGLEQQLAVRIGERGEAQAHLAAAVAIRLGLLLLAGAGLAGFALTAEPPGAPRDALLLALPALAGRSLSMLAKSVIVGCERAPLHIRLTASMRLLEVVCGATVLLAGGGLFAILAIHSASWVLEGAVALGLIHRRLVRLVPRLDLSAAADLLRRGWKLGLAMAFTAWLTSGPLVLTRQASGDLVQLGQVGLALQVAGIGLASGQIFFSAALPVLGRSLARGEAQGGRFGLLAALATLAVTGPAALLAFAFGPWIVTTALGPEFRPAGELLGFAALMAGVALAPAGVMQHLLVRGALWPNVAAGALGGLTLPLCLGAAIGAMGPPGVFLAAGAAWAARGLVLAVCAMRLARRDAAAGLGADRPA